MKLVAMCVCAAVVAGAIDDAGARAMYGGVKGGVNKADVVGDDAVYREPGVAESCGRPLHEGAPRRDGKEGSRRPGRARQQVGKNLPVFDGEVPLQFREVDGSCAV